MINIDESKVEGLCEQEFWLLFHLAKRANNKNECWPSNSTLCRDTNWNIKKLQRYKKSLIDKKWISIKPRKKDGSLVNDSNVYRILKSGFSNYFLSEKGMPQNGVGGIPQNGVGGIPQNGVGGIPQNGVGGIPQNGVTEPLKIEPLKRELYIEEIEADNLPKEEKRILAAIENGKAFFEKWPVMIDQCANVTKDANFPKNEITRKEIIFNQLEKWIRYCADSQPFLLTNIHKNIPSKFLRWMMNYTQFNKNQNYGKSEPTGKTRKNENLASSEDMWRAMDEVVNDHEREM